MKRLLSFILIFAYLTAAFQFTVPYLSYYTNYTYFATEACINKHNPELECNGKCQLQKMVKNQHNKHDTTPDEAVMLVKNSSTIFFVDSWVKPFFNTRAESRTFISEPIFGSQHNAQPVTPPPRLG